jgi:hypothetical protein
MVEHIIYESSEENWKRSVEEMEDDHWEEKDDDYELYKHLELTYRNMKLKSLKNELNSIIANK